MPEQEGETADRPHHGTATTAATWSHDTSANLSTMVDAVRRSLEAIETRLDLPARIEQRPWRTIGMALGAGYLLGGGLFTPLTRKAVGVTFRIGLRLAAIPVIRDEMFRFVESLAAHPSDRPVEENNS